METITNWAEVTMQAFSKMGEQLSSGLLNLLGAILILIIGWLITKLVLFLLKKLLKVTTDRSIIRKIDRSQTFR